MTNGYICENGEWVNASADKANLFAKNFRDKAELPQESVDCPYFGTPDAEFEDFVVLRTRYTEKLLRELDENKATGPDHIPAKVLKEIAKELALPFTILCRRLWRESCWPTVWKLHLICPLYKRGSAFMPKNYRGIHLTAVLSKVAERVIGRKLLSILHTGKFGHCQWAFTPGLSSRDLVTATVMMWILAFCTGNKIGTFLGDITGAFDRVFKAYLLAKLHKAGVGAQYLNFLDAYLEPRRAAVVVEGVRSDEFTIDNSVFQGTVLGPPLWNVFFEDVTPTAASTGGKPAEFADDLTVSKKFPKNVSNAEIKRDLQICRTRVHAWGRADRVEFDPEKEHLVVLHPVFGEGDAFKYLGCFIDCKLTMREAVDKILSQIRPKVHAILRTRVHYSIQDLIGQFKTHVWGHMEYQNGAIFHASDYILQKLDNVHTHFLTELGLSQAQAFEDYNFAPPCLRRDIGMLGMLHKRVLGQGHPIFQELLPFHLDARGYLHAGQHSKQLYGHLMEIQFHHGFFFRSIFAMVYVYNRLPQHVVDCTTISEFQAKLTLIAKMACQLGDPKWMGRFSCRDAVY